MKLSTTLILLLLNLFIFSQSKIDRSNCRDGENVEYCKTHKMMNKLKNNPSFYKQFLKDQEELKKTEDQISGQSRSGVVYTIPVVFHVLHNGGIENISKDQILDAVAILNRDFRLQNTDANNVQSTFSSMPSDIEVEFKLATKAPNGQCFSGITRTQNALTNDGSSGQAQVAAITAGNDVYNSSWPGNKYLNIFVVNEAGGAAGYTTNPSNWSSTSMRNGIWILHDYVGSIGTSDNSSSRSLTHEVGHWLNLEHLWGPNNNPGTATSCSSDDGVDDTPRCIGVTACILTSNSCSNDAQDGYWSSDVVDNVENYMEYSYCSKMFTNGQKTRMRSALVSSVGGRNNLWRNNNLISTGTNSDPTVCAVEISVAKDLVCGNDNVQFYDESYNNIVSWNWSFPGGSPSSSNSKDPITSYSSSGNYDVTLQVTDGAGNIMSKTFSSFITVLGSNGNTPPIFEGFENMSSLPNNNWTIDNLSGPGFQVVSSASASGSRSVKLDNSIGTNGSVDELISNTIDLSNSDAASISFKYAFAKRNSSNTDYLQIYASKDCGDSWALRKNIYSSVLATRANTNSSFTPTGSDWKVISISPNTLNNFLVSNFRFKFKFVNGGGNDLFIDDINLSGSVSINELEGINSLKIQPNPVIDNSVISFYSNSNLTNVTLDLYDAMGRLVIFKRVGNLPNGDNKIEIPSSDLESGWYLIMLKSQEKIISNNFLKK